MTLTLAPTILTIVRHGDTFFPGEPPRRIGARTDLPLVASGEAQARALGAAFAGERIAFDRVLAAPLRRTQATAELMLGLLPAGSAIETAAWLAEIDHGPDEGQSEDAVLARIGPEALARWNEDLAAPPGWTVDAPARLEAWRTLMVTGRGHLLLVTSNGAARFALHADPALARQASALASRRLRTGAWGRIVVADGAARIAAWDRRPGEAQR
ncbi:histidine phosphatase family protein [uncultured Sphingomonas sp.]|uniref:histidine phosphatase family protein n=1 Tax=uncultured Sphingomonas sp. TaxID=158754 RepID=UPI0035CBE5C2